jgi:hypothetical protein
VPTQRSAITFALGARGGVWITWIPTAVNTASKATVNKTARIAGTAHCDHDHLGREAVPGRR